MKCKQCQVKVTKETSVIVLLKRFCSFECAAKFGKANIPKGKEIRRKEQKKSDSEKLRNFKLNDKSLRKREAQKAFNAYIRERDKNEPCISCCNRRDDSDSLKGGNWHAGHYKTAGGFPELRFEELNCHKQCAYCNNFLSGNLANYRINLINKIGLDKVEWLESKHEPKRYTCEDLLAIEQKYKLKLKELKLK